MTVLEPAQLYEKVTILSAQPVTMLIFSHLLQKQSTLSTEANVMGDREKHHMISQSRREQLHGDLWSITYDKRRGRMFHNIKHREPKRRRTKVKRPSNGACRSCSCSYFMPQENGDIVKVSKEFFLHTKGYWSDKVVIVLLQTSIASQITPTGGMHGRHKHANNISDETSKLMRDHIESYHPSLSHYRREHAPLRRYLPPGLMIRSMYAEKSICC